MLTKLSFFFKQEHFEEPDTIFCCMTLFFFLYCKETKVDEKRKVWNIKVHLCFWRRKKKVFVLFQNKKLKLRSFLETTTHFLFLDGRNFCWHQKFPKSKKWCHTWNTLSSIVSVRILDALNLHLPIWLEIWKKV